MEVKQDFQYVVMLIEGDDETVAPALCFASDGTRAVYDNITDAETRRGDLSKQWPDSTYSIWTVIDTIV